MIILALHVVIFSFVVCHFYSSTNDKRRLGNFILHLNLIKNRDNKKKE